MRYFSSRVLANATLSSWLVLPRMRNAVIAPYDPGSPCEIRVEFTNSSATDAYRVKAGVEIVNSRELVSRADTWWAAWQQFFF